MREIKTKKNKGRTKPKLVKAILFIALVVGGYYGYEKYTGNTAPLKNAKKFISSSWNNKTKKTTKRINIDKKFLWKYIKKKNGRSIALVTSRNKFNDHDISLGFRCAFNG